MDITEDERRYAEDVGLVAAQTGMPPAYGRLLGWLLICDPPAQTSGELAAALGLSKGSVSTGMRMLEKSGLAQRVAVPGRRGHAYEITPDAMIKATSDAAAQYTVMSRLMERGLALLGDETAPRARRIRITRDFFAFIAVKVPEMIDEFKRDHEL